MAQPLVVSADDRVQLESMARSQSLPAALSRRAQMILRMADGEPQTTIAHRYGVSRPTVTLWRTRYRERGIAGLHNELKPGRPRTTSDEKVAELVNTVLTRKPNGNTHWSRRTLAEETGRSTTTVHRYMTLFGLQPHRSKRFKLSTDAFFIEKVRDIVGLYLNPPDHALVLCVDEKSQVQALERTQPVLPMGLGYVEGITHDDVRHGTTPLFAALDVANGSVITQCKPLHRHQEFLSFLRHVDAQVPQDLDVHLICDNDTTHKHARIKAWLAKRPRYHMHYTPTYSSWLNQVERWFGLITQRAIRRDSFDSVADLKRKINAFVEHYNQNPRPFKWTATADSILAKIERLCKVINGTPH
ncbi:IS630 family transposase [Xanthomonas oryzae pv. oryzae]|uniref:IS630 family transposase n=31 Tax=Xanthomonas oryzae TaxID=347 RepID=A0AAJ5MG32_XANOO|nr:transposase [Xanthomonas oryzae pv. oryzae]OLK07220.1 transposase [Xanthomonas oryzae pv. oryzae]QEJ70933.1 IS630 family transposase [Xanthomonas oryzae pv. oryzae]QQD51399.1 IS630 family transposase [Xanthomonas oryzae pv. oryzae]UXV84743.1 IS630 family transposase [Xanthomonas oryzae pv. oryzae]